MRRRWLVSIGLPVALAALIAGVLRLSTDSTQNLLSQAKDAFERHDYEQSAQLAQCALSRSRESVPALLLAGRASMMLKRNDSALAFFCRVPDDGSADSVAAHCFAGRVHRQSGNAFSAEASFRRALARDPQHLTANEELAELLVSQGRNWEAIPHLLQVVRQGAFQPEHLVALGYGALVLDESPIPSGREGVAQDGVLLLRRARVALDECRYDEAEKSLRQILAAAPHLVQAQAWMGELLRESGQPGEFLNWHRQLAPPADEHPEIWRIRGRWALDREHYPAAARCYWQAVRLDPDHEGANYQLARMLTLTGDTQNADPFRERAAKLTELINLLDEVTQQGKASAVPRLVDVLRSLGRFTEAWSWCEVALSRDATADWARKMSVELAPQLIDGASRTAASHNPAMLVDLSRLPLPHWELRPEELKPRQSSGRSAEVRFVDQSASAGLEFTYFNGAARTAQTNRMYEVGGGGVAVLDYDADGWPDVYLTQGSTWPAAAETGQFLDQLFRNRGDGRFENITSAAGLGDPAYGQGCTAGDFDNDGFPDLYVANIGPNRLYRNNGDGTFADVTEETATAGRSWTSSCLMADLNGDGFPDLYEVNYLEGRDQFEKVCRDHRTGRPEVCQPILFAAAPDRLYVNLGDGRFEDRSAGSGIFAPGGKGLGILAADFDGSGRLSLFVANDGTANFFFTNTSKAGAECPTFVERALTAGVAFDGNGAAQASMGIAAADADGDGRLDLYVTNFYDEPNTLYRQYAPEFFIDATRQAGLAAPSLKRLGWGTQFLDADLDGHPDLVVANGHIGDFRYRQVPYAMRPQLYRNQGEGKFEELPGEELGPYFERELLGRGLARLDWNRDGKEDFIVSHLFDPVALVTNATPRPGHFLAVRLKGVTSEREAIGSVVRLTAGGQGWVRQLTAGDGFQAANERQLVFGLGDRSQVELLHVRWPSGIEQTFRDLAIDREILLIEGGPNVESQSPLEIRNPP